MTRFLIKLAVFIAIQLAILAYVVSCGSKTTGSTFYSAMSDKLARLNSIQGPRLIIIGGSSAVFGLDSSIVGKGMQGEPVNLGLHAGLGHEFYLRMVEDYVRPGDTIVLVPEYEMAIGLTDETTKHQMSMACPQFKRYLRADDSAFAHLKTGLDHDALRTLHVWTHRALRRERKPPTIDPNAFVYSREGFNPLGDFVGHYDLDPIDKSEYAPVKFSDEEVQLFVDRLNEFGTACQQAGAQVYLSYPPINRARYQASEEALRKYETVFNQQLVFPVLDRPQDHMFDEDLFFDTFYHLTREAGIERSSRMNEKLRTRLAEVPAASSQLR